MEKGLACIPAERGFGRIIRDVLDWSEKYPDDWKKTWRLIEEKWDKNDPSPGGALQPFNIDAKLNGAYVALGLLYGAGDFSRTMDITTRWGADSDCNPASAGGILGVMLGCALIPDPCKSGIPALAEVEFPFSDYSFTSIVRSTIRALKVVQKDSLGLESGTGLLFWERGTTAWQKTSKIQARAS